MMNDKAKIGRRDFMKASVTIAIAQGVISCKDDKEDGADPEKCATTVDILGPFYKADAPFREDITPAENQEMPLIIEGKVFGDCDTALSDAVVEIWNADGEGAYDMSGEFRFRGRYRTEGDGVYRFKTIIPGRYLNGSTYRPSHIHFRITAPGYGEFVSQIYFKNDPFIDHDPWASASKASERILPLGKDTNGTDTVNFNIYLTRA